MVTEMPYPRRFIGQLCQGVWHGGRDPRWGRMLALNLRCGAVVEREAGHGSTSVLSVGRREFPSTH